MPYQNCSPHEKQALLDAVDQHFLVSMTDLAGTITYVNDRFCRVSGYAREELIGSKHSVLSSRAHTPSFWVEVWNTISAGHAWSGVVCDLSKSGTLYWLQTRISPLFDPYGKVEKYLSVRTDVTEEKLAKMQLRDRTEQLDAIFSLSPDGFVSFDREHHVKYVNPAFVQMTSPVPVHLQGLNVQEFSAWLAQRSDVDTPCLDLAVLRAKVMANQPDSSVILEVNGNGKRVLKVSLRQSESASVSEILYFRDVTHESEVDQMKSEFLATAAHELRTPMASILGFSEVLLNQEFDPATQLELLGIIHKQSGLMAKILDELLDLARIEARQGKDFVFTPTPVHVVIDQLVLGYKPPKGRERPWVLVPSTAFTIYADSQKMQQAVLQVLSNAYKYSPEGGPVQIEVIGPQGGALQAQWIGIRITDQGIGMTEAQLSRVFERFYRADTSGKILGTGLGMSIVHEIVALHGGKVELISAPGQGTTVTLWMPTTERIDQPGNTT